MNIKLPIAVAVCIALHSAAVFAVEHTKDSLATVRKNIEQQKAMLVDVREPSEWKQGRFKDATHIALSDLRKASGKKNPPVAISDKLSKKKIIYCHCAAGFRVIPAAKILKTWGFDVRPLAADYDELREAGFQEAK